MSTAAHGLHLEEDCAKYEWSTVFDCICARTQVMLEEGTPSQVMKGACSRYLELVGMLEILELLIKAGVNVPAYVYKSIALEHEYMCVKIDLLKLKSKGGDK